MCMSEKQAEDDTERTVIRTGREFEREYRLSSERAGAFLVEIGEKLQDGDEIKKQPAGIYGHVSLSLPKPKLSSQLLI